MTLGPAPTNALADIIDDEDKYAEDLWYELAKLYATTNVQAIINLTQRREGIRFKGEGDFNHNINQMREIL